MNTDLLIAHIRGMSRPLEPAPTDEEAVISPLKGIRAVVFDVYGTLFISGSGDISLARAEDRSPAIRGALATAGWQILQEDAPWSAAFMETLERFRSRRAAEGIPFPEVRIGEVWDSFIGRAGEAGWLEGTGNRDLAIVDHEARVNPVWPMPGLKDTLGACRETGLLLGIVSNAQFYTPLLFSAFLGKSHAACGFPEDLCVWSYKEREGKPSQALYQKLKDNLLKASVGAGETLYVGNDLRNDIWPAQRLGFRTALFAGDRRSLRWRRDDPQCRDIRPDRIVTDLRQIPAIVT